MKREIIGPLEAWDATADALVPLEPGTEVDEFRIHKNLQSEIDAGAEPYEARFTAGRRRYGCTLPKFMARTQAVVDVRAEVFC